MPLTLALSPSMGRENRLIHRNEPLRRVAENERLLRAPGMRIGMFEPSAREEIAGVYERLDHRLVGVALLALVVDDALAGKARRLLGEEAVGIDGIGNARVDLAPLELGLMRHPDVEVLAAVARRGVDEAGARIFRDVLSIEERNGKSIARNRARERMGGDHAAQLLGIDRPEPLMSLDFRGLEDAFGQGIGENVERPRLCPIIGRRRADAVKT